MKRLLGSLAILGLVLYIASCTQVPNNKSELANIEVSPGVLTPAFDPSILDYTVELPIETTAIEIKPIAQDPNVLFDPILVDLVPGIFLEENIDITLPDGSRKRYVVYIKCGTPMDPEPSPEATIDPEATPDPEVSPSPEVTPEVSPSPSPSATPGPTPSPTASPIPSPSPSTSPGPTPTPTVSPGPTPTISPTPSPSPSPTATPFPGYSKTGFLPNGLIDGQQVAYTVTAEYKNSKVLITFKTLKELSYAYAYLPGHRTMSGAGTAWTLELDGYKSGDTLTWYVLVRQKWPAG